MSCAVRHCSLIENPLKVKASERPEAMADTQTVAVPHIQSLAPRDVFLQNGGGYPSHGSNLVMNAEKGLAAES
jgi:hypothetical protein